MCIVTMRPVFGPGEWLRGLAALDLLFALTIAPPATLLCAGAALLLLRRDPERPALKASAAAALVLGVLLCAVQALLLPAFIARDAHPLQSIWEEHVLRGFARAAPVNALSQDYALGGDVLADHPEIAQSEGMLSWHASKDGAGYSRRDFNLRVFRGFGRGFDAEAKRMGARRTGQFVVLENGIKGTFYPSGKRVETDAEDGPRKLDIWPALAWRSDGQWYFLDRPEVSCEDLKSEASSVLADRTTFFLAGRLAAPRSYLALRPASDLRWVAGDFAFVLNGTTVTLSVRHSSMPQQTFLYPPEAKRTDRSANGVRYVEYQLPDGARGVCICCSPREGGSFCRVYRFQTTAPDPAQWRSISGQMVDWVVRHEERGKKTASQ